MSDHLCEIDYAMNIIKEEIIKELSECVSRQNKQSYYSQNISNNLAFFEENLD